MGEERRGKEMEAEKEEPQSMIFADYIIAWSASKWTRAAEIIRHTGAGWADSDIDIYEVCQTKA